MALTEGKGEEVKRKKGKKERTMLTKVHLPRNIYI